MRQSFEVPGRFPSLNEWCRMGAFEQNRVKEECDGRVAWAAMAARIRPCRRPIRYHVLWVEQNRRRDLDNVAFGKKFVQDGLVKAGVLANDSHHEIRGFGDSFAYDSVNPRIVVTLEEA